MKVAQIVQSLKPGGLEVLALELLQHVPSVEGHWIISLDGSSAQLVADWPRLQLFETQIVGLEKPAGLSFKALVALRRVLLEKQIDVVHTHHIGPLLYGGAAARLAGVSRLVHTEHDVWHLDAGRAEMVEKLALKLARPLHVAITKAMAEDLSARFGRPVEVIANGIDTARFVPPDTANVAADRRTKDEGRYVIGTAGRLQHVKGMDVLIEAVAILKSRGEPVLLNIAGDGDEAANLRKLAQGCGLGDEDIVFLGHIDSMPAFLRALDVYVQPSRREGLPLAPLEALSAGCRVVMTDVGGAAEIEAAGGTIIPSENPAALADAIVEAMRCPIDPLSQHENMVREFDIRKVAARYRAVYEEVS